MLADDEGAGAGVDHDLRAGVMKIGDGVAVIEPSRDEAFVVPEVFADGEPPYYLVKVRREYSLKITKIAVAMQTRRNTQAYPLVGGSS